jgi:hypothetical protein
MTISQLWDISADRNQDLGWWLIGVAPLKHHRSGLYYTVLDHLTDDLPSVVYLAWGSGHRYDSMADDRQ